MAVRTFAQFKALYGTSGSVFPDNTTGDISEGDVRSFGEDIADSFYSSSIFQVSGTMSSAAILNSFSVPIELIPAQDPGIIALPLNFFFFLDYNSAPYATNTDFYILYGSTSFIGPTSGILASSADYHTYLNAFNFITANTMANQPIKFQTATGNPTAGNSPIKYNIIYRLVNIL